jgi:hypothetical protein
MAVGIAKETEKRNTLYDYFTRVGGAMDVEPIAEMEQDDPLELKANQQPANLLRSGILSW